MVSYYEQCKVALAMIKWGGGFIRSLGEALMLADHNEAREYRDKLKKLKKE